MDCRAVEICWSVVGIQRNRPLHVLLGPNQIACFALVQGQIVVPESKARSEIQRPTIIGDRIFGISLQMVGYTSIKIRPRELVIKASRNREKLYGLVVPAQV